MAIMKVLMNDFTTIITENDHKKKPETTKDVKESNQELPQKRNRKRRRT